MNKLVFWMAALLLCGRAWSIDPELRFEQLNQKMWTLAEGAPPDITSMAQTTDGTLWLGSEGGLYRFDGIRFSAFTAQWQIPFVSNEIYSLAASPDGGLWIGSRAEGLSFLKNGHVDRYDFSKGIGHGTVERILIDDQGTVWVAGFWGLARKEGTRFVPVVFDTGDAHASAWAMLQDRAGTLWVLGQNSVVARPAGENNFREVVKRTYKSYASTQDLAEAADGSVWAARVDARGFLRLNPPTNPPSTGNRLIPIASADILIFDGEGNLWFNSNAGAGRITSTSLRANLSDQQAASRAEYFDNSQALGSSGGANAFLEDREGNLWVASPAGIVRLSPSNVLRPPIAGLRGNQAVIAAGDAGRLIAAVPLSDSSSRIIEVSGNTIVRETTGPPITNSFRDADGTTWLNGPAGISKYKDGRFETTPPPAQIGYRRINAVTRDGKGALWVAFGGGGQYRYSDGLWREAQELVPKLWRHPAIIAAAADAQGQLWLSFGRPLVIVSGANFRVLDADNGFNLGIIGAIVARQTHVWVGGELGLVRFDGARMSAIRSAPGNPLTRISGIVETGIGDLWLNTGVGIVHIPHAEIERTIIDSSHFVRYEAFTFSDGVPGPAEPGDVAPSIVEAGDGRIWFSSQAGVAYIDPLHIRRNSLPPPVSIWSIESGGIQYPVTIPSSAIRLPASTKNLQVTYTAGSLTAPERVQFRYKLDGLDGNWQDAGDRRDVTFANLGPGQYIFHVIAANNDGIWNNEGASTVFTIIPAFYQTKWFYGFCALLCALLIRVIYMLRIRQISAQVRGRLEERLAERERIARDLHDTLLQSVQGLILRLRAAVKQERSSALVEQSLERADEVLAEARDRVKHLRSSPKITELLIQDLANFGQELAVGQFVHFRSTVVGTPCDLNPIVREEALFIAREALTNAFRHANAREIEADLSYGEVELRIRIRDDGKGIDAELLERGGRDEHWGLLGMRERAKTIRGTLTIWSKPHAGTEIDLRIPGHFAYPRKQRSPFRWWPRRDLSD